ncbi:Tm-1-like ATP-binding domain-containing protein [Sphaerisporangium sp. NPDC051017]|uniref:Tm-1-like ATP-binding domain-containing protein n=1 Tax=Sphaerisporangium sp. NPDC051017 TaxID=3154636 RepID=UPI0034309BD3
MNSPSRRPDVRRAGSPTVVVVIGTFDTKAEELGVLADEIEAQGATAVLMDTSARLTERPSADVIARRTFIDQEQVAAAAGSTSAAISALPRGEAVSALRAGVTALLERMVAERSVDGAVCMGGAGTHIAGPAFQRLPLGFPKLIISPLASGGRTFEAYVGIKDVAVLHSVADIIGVNSVTSGVYRSAAGYIVGAARHVGAEPPWAERTSPTIAASMNGNTTPALMRGRERLEAAGYSFVAFHANGVGGRALEDAVASGKVDIVLDFTTTELAGHLVGGLMDPGPERMETAGRRGVRQVLVPGCLDFITCGRLEDAEQEFPGRVYFGHNPELTLVRLTRDEAATLGKEFARKANLATGPVTVYVPTGGLSIPDAPGGPFWDPEADTAFLDDLREGLQPQVELITLPWHINDPRFIDRIVDDLLVGSGAADGAARPCDAVTT